MDDGERIVEVDKSSIDQRVLDTSSFPLTDSKNQIDGYRNDSVNSNGNKESNKNQPNQADKEEKLVSQSENDRISNERREVAITTKADAIPMEVGDSDSNQPKEATRVSDGRTSFRHLVAILALSSIVLANMNRQAFNVSLPQMIKNKPKSTSPPIDQKQTIVLNEGDSCPSSSNESLSTVISNYETTTSTITEIDIDIEGNDDRFNWSGHQTGQLQSAFSLGYAPFMILGGRLSELYGAKWVVLLSGAGSALCCILTPFLADNNFYLLLASRTFMGLSQTGVSPSLFALCARWLTPEESSIYLPLIKVGVMLGMLSGSLISGFLTWRLTFYVTGFIGFIWSIIWFIFATSDPSEHKMVNKAELDYIVSKIEKRNKGRKMSVKSARNKSAPWLNILTNRVVIVFMLTKFTVKLASDTQSIELPVYLSNVFHVDKRVNGLLTSINFAIQGLFTGLVAWLAKEMVYRRMFGMSKTAVRKLFQSICQFGCGISFLLVTFNGCNIHIVMAAIILTSISCMFSTGGEGIIPMDLSNDYPASIMAMANSCANLSGIILPTLVFQILGQDIYSKEKWNIVWTCVGFASITGGTLWLLFANAELQDFSRPFVCCNIQSTMDDQDKCDSYEECGKPKREKKVQKNTEQFVMIDMNGSRTSKQKH